MIVKVTSKMTSKKTLLTLALMVSAFAMAQEQKVLAGRDINE